MDQHSCGDSDVYRDQTNYAVNVTQIITNYTISRREPLDIFIQYLIFLVSFICLFFPFIVQEIHFCFVVNLTYFFVYSRQLILRIDFGIHCELWG